MSAEGYAIPAPPTYQMSPLEGIIYEMTEVVNHLNHVVNHPDNYEVDDEDVEVLKVLRDGATSILGAKLTQRHLSRGF